jgi:hypothetical protein
LQPTIDPEQNAIVDYGKCRMIEGQFENDVTNGFARMVRSDGFTSIGWWKNGFLHGYGK